MPELPEVETVRRGLVPVLEGATIDRAEVRRAGLRYPFPPGFGQGLNGATVLGLDRRAKYLLAALDTGQMLVVHLGMSGSFRTELALPHPASSANDVRQRPGGKDSRHDHVVLHLRGGTRVVYNDPRRFGFMDLISADTWAEHPWFVRLGPEPTGNALSAVVLAEKISGRRAPLKAVLLDQAVIAGLGNIYVCEALWRAHLSPRRMAASLVTMAGSPTARLGRLTDAIRSVIGDAIDAGGSSLRDHVRTDGTLGYFQHRFSVYGRQGEPCARQACRGTIRRIVQSGRSTFFCPTCQR